MTTDKTTEFNKQRTELHRQERLGQRIKNMQGLWVEIIEYHNSTNMTVRFEDGTIRHNVTWYYFQKGWVKKNLASYEDNKTTRIGQSRVMNNGLTATIIKYRNAHDIDVQFEDGVVVQHRVYNRFKDGFIGHPTIKFRNTMSIPEFAISYYLLKLGFVKIAAGDWKERGFNYELDFYHPAANIAIEYDGAIHNRISSQKNEIIKNQLCNDLGIVLYRIRDPYLKIKNLDGSINYNLQKSNFINGRILDCKQELEEILTKHNIKFQKDMIDFHRDTDVITKQYELQCAYKHARERVGETGFSNKAQQKMKIIAYHDAHNIDVKFEDGAIRKKVYYTHFQSGQVSHPSQMDDAYPLLRIGETRTMLNGLDARICIYRTNKDIDVEFLIDGKINKHVSYNMFKKGRVAHPDYDTTFLINKRKKLGQIRIAPDGQHVKIVEYRSGMDLDILYLESNKLIQHIAYANFLRRTPYEFDSKETNI